MTETAQPLESIPLEAVDVGRQEAKWKIADAKQALITARALPVVPLSPDQSQSYQPGIMIADGWQDFKLLTIHNSQVKYTRGHSSNNVLFSRLDLRPTFSTNTESVEVAVKRIARGSQGVKEALNNMEVLKRGFSNTTKPIAVIRAATESYILTKAEPNIKTLDEEPWHQFGSSNEAANQHFIRLMAKLGMVIADLETLGIGIQDSQLKNFWLTPLGVVWAFDWEHARFFDRPVSTEQIAVMATEDLRHLYWSLAGRYEHFERQVLNNKSDRRWDFGKMWEVFEKYVYHPYETQLKSRLSAQTHLSKSEIEELFADYTDPNGETVPSLKSALQEAVLANSQSLGG